MSQVLEAVYENGAFRPLISPAIGLTEGQHVRIVVATNGPSEILGSEILDLAAQVYAGLPESDVAEVETIALDRSSFFSGREP